MTNDERMTKSERRSARAEDSFWDDGAGLVREEPETKRVYDLEERTARFGESLESVQTGGKRREDACALQSFAKERGAEHTVIEC
jgi:hypothetical protein